MIKPHTLQGVGNGTQAEWQMSLSISVSNGTDTELHVFETPVVSGSGEVLPSLLGHRSIRARNGVVETMPGGERLTFPGPGGYIIKWAPGALHIPLTPAPSGHLVISSGNDSDVKRATGLPQPRTTLHAVASSSDGLAGTSSGSSSGQHPESQ